MIPKEVLRSNMIFKYCSSITGYNPISIKIGVIGEDGPQLINLETDYDYGILGNYNYSYFHKFNTPKEKIIKDLQRAGVM